MSNPEGVSKPSTPQQEFLDTYCKDNGWRNPVYSIASDRRGGRTAWSCCVEVQGINYNATHWYDGRYITNAREDAAAVALSKLNPASTSTAEVQQQQ